MVIEDILSVIYWKMQWFIDTLVAINHLQMYQISTLNNTYLVKQMNQTISEKRVQFK